MLNDRTRRMVACAACLGFACLILSGLGSGPVQAQAPDNLRSAPILGLTPAKLPTFRIISARDPSFSQFAARAADGDTYDAAGLVQDTVSGYYVDDLPDSHTFGTEESAGLNLITNVDTRILAADYGPGLPDTNFVQINYFTVDGSEIVPAGTLSPESQPFDAWRFDVGTEAAGTDKINWTSGGGFTIVTSGFCLGDGGEILGCFDLALDNSDANSLAGVGLVGSDTGDIAGVGVDEMIIYWEIQEAASSFCGDGTVDLGEQCDDGNNISGDGCSSTCRTELTIPADFDRDGDVDLDDFATFQRFFTGV